MWISRYTLKPKRALSAIAREGVREGALIRVGDGFEDMHPWPELGDEPLDGQLKRLARAMGQMAAAWVAATNAAGVSSRCFLFTHVLFDRDPFFEQIRAKGSRLLAGQGTGFGFDDLLLKLPWKKLA